MAWLTLTSTAGFTLGLAAITATGIVLAYLAVRVLGPRRAPRRRKE